MESAETTFQDTENGGVFDENVIPEMTEIAKSNINFSQSELLVGAAVAPNTGWTVAALVAQTSGTPLKLAAGKRHINFDSCLPGVVSIGDLLEQQGYHNVFMAGSDFSFAGKQEYFTQHGNYEILDYSSALETGMLPEGYRVYWGFEDQKLYEFAKEKITALANEEQPFHFSMLTVDTHAGSNGEAVCALCPDKFENQYLNIWACASSQLADFINWLKRQDFYENTVIYIAGDHSSMQSDAFAKSSDFDIYTGTTERTIYNAFINSVATPVNTKNRRFTTLDFCPSILAAMGAEIEGNRIGLGTNLFSDEPTLAEKYGYDEMFQELRKKSPFYDRELLYPQK
ncbi:MAG: LTA synthase family protein [Eubacterium sp.]|nr:LTA synthase family protein [Eubacterium sp.]